MSKKHKKFCRVLNYIDHSLIAICTITVCVSISAFTSLVVIPIGITFTPTGLKICVTTVEIKKYKSMIKKKRKEYDIVVLLAKSKLNNIEVLTSKDLIDSNISHDEFVLINNVLKEHYNMKEEFKSSNNK